MKLSIITINYNNLEGLELTLNSVKNQTSKCFEHIIIDGASSDGSKELIEKYVENNSVVSYWVSEKDAGIYNAMNNGIIKAKGEYLLFLNSGDWLYDKNVVTDFLNQTLTEDFICGHIELQYDIPKTLFAVKKEEMTYEYLYVASTPHQSTFIKNELFQKYGFFNESLKIVSDWEFLFKCVIVNNCSYIDWDRVVSCLNMNGISHDEKSRSLIKSERANILNTHIPLVQESYKRLEKEIVRLNDIEKKYKEYLELKNGKFGFIIKFILLLKGIKNKI